MLLYIPQNSSTESKEITLRMSSSHPPCRAVFVEMDDWGVFGRCLDWGLS